ncbi:hypothetical protein HELRODRAFT_187100 [Helobdella robusta]|uniref:cGMP-dependent protein kinase n=1 Tax=Helobdella robusta TaxID=6412 RepID=T1FP70_HELRO|nr:hypothetical protein HELRODRAFT_187100 [Helobdella robusta]ESO03016.1 hypothetical protein HELRODRAFT_187100 [Helobdella robusta]
MGSNENLQLDQLNAKIQQLEMKIKELEKVISEKDQTIQDLYSQLDKYKSIIPTPASRLMADSRRKVRAQGISAEPKKLKGLEDLPTEQFKSHPKSSKLFNSYIFILWTKDFLIEAIRSNEFMKNLSAQNIKEIVEHMYPVEYKKGSVIIKEGDVGSIVYVMEVGLVEVTKEGMRLSVMTPGKVFGELAVLYNCTRTATVTALDPCKLWALDRHVYQGVLIRAEMMKEKEKMELIKKVPKYRNESENVLKHLVDTLDEMVYSKNSKIINQHDIVNCLYIISKGVVSEIKDDGKLLRTYKAGEYFGCVDSIGTINLSQVALEPQDIRSVADLKLVATIGIGGFGRVDLVQPLHDTNRSFALKRMKKSHIVETRQQEHILNERNIMLECKCDFVVKLFKTFKDNKYLYMLMEPCLGGELWTLLRDKVSFDDSTSRFYVSCVIEALTYLHSKGIIYRDLKPENLLLDDYGYIKMVDFGFAKKIGVGRRTWTFCGTPEYVAPEIILNRGHDATSDLWSLGILAYELLSGNPPFTASEPMKTYNLILKGIDNVSFSSQIPKHAQSFIRKLCRDNPSDRLGHGSINLKDVRKHKWLNNFNWEALKNKALRAPFILLVKDRSDVSNFDTFPPDTDPDPPDDLTGWDKDF